MNLMIGIVLIGVGIAIGMYIASQIESHIARGGQNKNLLDNMHRLDGQRPAEKPGAMILDELREQEALSQTREALIARHKTKLSSEFKKMEDDPCKMDNEDLEGTGMRWTKEKI